MAFGNYQNDKAKKKSVNTQGYQFYNGIDLGGSTLAMGYWNSMLTIKIHPMLPENKRSENSKYDYESVVSVALTPKKAFEFAAAINKINHAVENKMYNFASSGVSSGTGFIEIAPASKFNGPENAVAIAIYNGISEEGKPSDQLVYVFNKGNYFDNYDSQNGSYDKSDDLETEFVLFGIMIREAINASTNAVAHSIRHVSMYSNDYTRQSLNEIKEKLGIQVSGGSGNSYSGNSSTTYFGNNRRQQNDNNENVGSIENGGSVQDRLPI